MPIIKLPIIVCVFNEEIQMPLKRICKTKQGVDAVMCDP